jgi:hypothetical protein
MQYRGTLADESALKQAFSLTGASGSRPCIRCRNVVARGAVPPGDGYLQPLDAPLSACDLQTTETLYERVALLREASATATEGALQKLEQALGMHPTEVFFDPSLRPILSIDSYIIDPMHVHLSSGICSWQMWGQRGLKKKTWQQRARRASDTQSGVAGAASFGFVRSDR